MASTLSKLDEVEDPNPERQENSARVVWQLAWPAVALNSLQVVNTLLDRGFIGHLSDSAVTAHGGSINVMFLMFSMSMALGTAATAIVSRAFGAGNRREYREAARQSVNASLVAGAVLSLICVLISPVTAQAILPPKDIAAMKFMSQFLVAYGLGLPAIYLIQSLAGALRGIGDTKSPMVISGIQILLHMLLNFSLVLGPKHFAGMVIPGAGLGLVGAGIALSTSAWIAALIYLLYGGRTPLGVLWRIRLPSREWWYRILRIAIPTATMAFLRVASLTAFTLVLKWIPGEEGSHAIAAMGIGFSIESMMFMPSFGLSVAASALVGQSLGMRDPDRAERLAWVAGHHGAIVTASMVVPIFFLSPAITHLLLDQKPLIALAATQLIQSLCVTEILFAYAMVMIGAMQGAGDTVRPMWITVICMWGLRVPLAYLCALPLGLNSLGAWGAMSFTQAVQGVLAILIFRKGAWKTARV